MNVKDTVSKLVVIGSGAAGLTAAIYAARGGIEPLVISGDNPGGQLILTSDVENFPGFPDAVKGPDLMANMRKQAERFGTRFIDRAVNPVDFTSRPFKITVNGNEMYIAESVILSTGSSAMWLGLESEAKLKGKRVSACATCDGFFFKGKDVVVVGGREVALEEALFLAKFTNSVKLVHRRDELRATRIMQQRAFNNLKISFIWNTVIEDILGDTKVEGIRTINTKTREKTEINCDGVFVAIGHRPNSEIFAGKVDLDEKGYVKRYHESKTGVEGVFVAGDLYDYTYRQAVTAAGSGCKAAIDVIKYLESNADRSTASV